MEMLSKVEISARYGVDVAENQAAVVTMEMPDALMRKAAEIAESKNFKRQLRCKVLLTILQSKHT